MDISGMEFEGVDPKNPDGPPATFRFAEGRLYAVICPDCKGVIGGGIENEKHKADDRKTDPYSPLVQPCVFCGKGPGVLKYADEET